MSLRHSIDQRELPIGRLLALVAFPKRRLVKSLPLTSEFRLLVSVPTAECLSTRIVDVPSRAAN